MQYIRKRYSYEEKLKILEKTNGVCAHCGRKLENSSEMTVEHIMPLSKGGKDEEFNLIALCNDCNSKKSNDVYYVNEYYSYISSKYIREYVEYNLKAVNSYDGDKGLGCVVKPVRAAYSFPLQVRSLICAYESLVKHGATPRSKQAIFDKIHKAQVTLKWCRAYTGDAREILNLLNRVNRKVNKRTGKGLDILSEYYNNEYAILDKIKNNMVLTLRNAALEIVGAVIFGQVEDVSYIPQQLKDVEEQTSLRAKYTVEMIALSDQFSRFLRDVRSDLFMSMIKQFYVPIEIVQYPDYSVKNSIQIPVQVHNVDAIMGFFTVHGIENRSKSMIDSISEIADREFTEEEREKLMDIWLNGSHELGPERLLIGVCELGADISDLYV